MTFNEANTVEAFIRDLLCGGVMITPPSVPALLVRTINSGLGWHYLSHHDPPRQPQEALVEDPPRSPHPTNPTIAANPERADDVIYQLRAIMGVRSDGLVKANRRSPTGSPVRSRPFGENGEHVTIKLIDFDDLEQNQYVVTSSTPSKPAPRSGPIW